MLVYSLKKISVLESYIYTSLVSSEHDHFFSLKKDFYGYLIGVCAFDYVNSF